jgi:hypothetical protein
MNRLLLIATLVLAAAPASRTHAETNGSNAWSAYHRFRIPDGNGYNRETCLSPLRHAEDGSLLPVDVFESVGLNGPASAESQSP